MSLPAYNYSDLVFIRDVRSARIVVDEEGKLKIVFAVSDDYAAKSLRELIIKEEDK